MRIPGLFYYNEAVDFAEYADLANFLESIDIASPFGKSLFAYVDAYHEVIVKAFHDVYFASKLPAFVVGREYSRFGTSRNVSISTARLKAVEKVESQAPLLKRLKRRLDAHLDSTNESGVKNGDAMIEEWVYQSGKNSQFARIILDLSSAEVDGDINREDAGGNIFLIDDDIAQ